MLNSILGSKIGMTQIFDDTGNIIPVTVIVTGPCIVTDVRTKEKNGYNAVQVGLGEVKEKSLVKPLLGQFKKRNIQPKRYVREFKVEDSSKFQVGQEVTMEMFKPGDYVDVSGETKGKGFAGTVKRHGFKGGVTTHGQSDRQRAPGSIGAQRPTHVIKGQRMAGRLGKELVTIQKLKVIVVDNDKKLMMVDGSVPGAKNTLLVIKKTVKKVISDDAKHRSQQKKGKGKK